MNVASFVDMLAYHEFIGHGVCPVVSWWLVWVQ